MAKPPRVFISYSHDNTAHIDWVLKLATDLRAAGIDANLDQWGLHPGQDIVSFMERSIRESDRVILICSNSYVEKANSGQGGVGYERLIISADVVADIDTRKFIPIIRNNDSANKAPHFLGARFYLDFNLNSVYKEQFDNLIREIHQAPALEKPPLEPTPFLKQEFEKIQTRIAFHAGETAEAIWSDPWFGAERNKAQEGLKKIGLKGAMELNFALSSSITKKQTELLESAHKSQIHTFGWPIGVVLANRDEYRPKPRVDGIATEIAIGERESYDYWALRQNGDFFLLQSYFEDMRRPNSIFFNTRIVRVTESLLYCRNLYTNLGLDSDIIVAIRVTHQGLRDRELTTSSPNRIVIPETTSEDICGSELTIHLGDIDKNLHDNVIKLTEPLFVLFNYKEFPKNVYAGIIDDFVAGKIY
jgi:hypothetical protein